jgi:hypothetical protein
MSQESVESVRAGLEAWNREAQEAFRWTPGDPVPNQIQDVASHFWDPDADYYPSRKFPESRPCHGREEIVRFFLEYFGAWERVGMDIKALIPVGDDRLLAHYILSGEGRGSGVESRAELYSCVWLRKARVLRWEDHFTLGAALGGFGLDEDGPEAVGLRE